MKTVALYLRVSSVDQHPETQLYDLRAMARQRGFQIVAEYTDRISGTKARRPGLDDLLRDARRGRFQVLLVWASDRIARSVRHFLEVLDELNHLNIEFVSFRENLDTGGPLGRAVVIIIGASQNSNGISSSNGCGQECAAPGWREGISAGGHSKPIGSRFFRNALEARA
jgi:DNA invertase Pin-like site-specific DNA recombinase